MSEPQQEYLWAPTPDKPRRGRVWLIVGLAVAAVAIAAALFWMFLPRTGPSADPTGTPGPTVSPSPTDSPTGTPSPTATAPATPDPTPTAPEVTPPAPPDPSVAAFREKVGPVLDDADTGLRMLGSMSGVDAIQVVDQLHQDGERLSDAVAPSSIADTWRSSTDAYLNALTRLRSAHQANSGIQAASDGATAAARSLRQLVGL